MKKGDRVRIIRTGTVGTFERLSEARPDIAWIYSDNAGLMAVYANTIAPLTDDYEVREHHGYRYAVESGTALHEKIERELSEVEWNDKAEAADMYPDDSPEAGYLWADFYNEIESDTWRQMNRNES